MKYEWDESKRADNLEKHGVDFAKAQAFEWDSALVTLDTRQDYGESRYRAYGFIGDRVYVLAYTERSSAIRIISFRKANRREILLYLGERND